MVIRELLIRLGLTGSEATGRSLDKVDDKVKKVTEGFRGLGGAIAGALAGFSLKSIIDVADEMQSLEFRLGQMITSTNGGAEAIENLSKHASDARVNIESYAEAYTGIGAATHELIKSEQDLLNVTDSVAMGLQLAGANTQQTTSVMMQLTQAIAVGKLQWADMRIIMQNSDAFASRLAKSLGMTLNEMVKATQGNGGGIGADKIVNALRNMSGEVKKEFASMPMTVHQAMEIIGNRWDMFIHRLNRSTTAISWIASKFLWLADKVEYSLDVVTEALGGAENAVKILGVALGAAGLVGAVYLLSAAFTALTSPIALAVGAIALLYLLCDDFVAWSQGRPSIMGDILGDYNNYKSGIDKFINALGWIKDAVGGWKTIFESFAVYLAGKWLTRVLATLGIATRAATSTGTAIATAGNAGGAEKGSGFLNKALTASFLYPAVEGAMDNLIGDTSFGKWAKNTTLGDLYGSRAVDSATSVNLTSLSPPRTYLGNSIGGVGGIPSIDYKPNINLTVNAATSDPNDIADAVETAIGNQARDFISGFGNTLNFNTGG